MIFVTVGGQLPFDRLLRHVDRWAASRERRDVLAQIGQGASYVPDSFRSVATMAQPAFRRTCLEATAIVAHAGMGTILTALELGKPIVVMPRRGDLGETRNNHQLATARALESRRLVKVAWDEDELADLLDHLGQFTASDLISHQASPQLIRSVRQFIHGQPQSRQRSEEAPSVPMAGGGA